MNVVHMPETGTNFIPYEVMGKIISFNDSELMFDASKKERDYEVVIDICQDYTGGLVMGAGNGEKYIAQLVIPAREYIETESDNPSYDADTAEGTESPTTTTREPVPFDIDNCELRLWEMEV